MELDDSKSRIVQWLAVAALIIAALDTWMERHTLPAAGLISVAVAYALKASGAANRNCTAKWVAYLAVVASLVLFVAHVLARILGAG